MMTETAQHTQRSGQARSILNALEDGAIHLTGIDRTLESEGSRSSNRSLHALLDVVGDERGTSSRCVIDRSLTCNSR